MLKLTKRANRDGLTDGPILIIEKLRFYKSLKFFVYHYKLYYIGLDVRITLEL